MAYTRDEHAYKQLFYYFHPSLYRFAFHILKDRDAAEDVVSDVMVNIWSMENRLAYIENLKLYLFKAVKNKSFTHLSQLKHVTVNIEQIQNNNLLITGDTADQKINTSETSQKIEKAIQALPAQCQMVFRLVREEGLSYKQVGEILEISQNTIETHMRIALQRIRLALNEYLLRKK